MLPGSIATPVKKLKLMTYTAYKNGWIAVNPFAGFYVKAEYSERRYLSASELQAVMNVKLPNYRTSINRDAFVFCAFTGLSHADVVKLTHADIHTDDNGERWIIDRRQKTGTQFRVKLLPVAEMLYKRYKDTYRTGEKVFPLKGTYKTLNMSPAMPVCRSTPRCIARGIPSPRRSRLRRAYLWKPSARCWDINGSPRPKSMLKSPMTRSGRIWRH